MELAMAQVLKQRARSYDSPTDIKATHRYQMDGTSELAVLLNDYFELLVSVVSRHDGTVGKTSEMHWSF